jgi:hypothetical protein
MDFSSDSRVWIYLSSREFTPAEINELHDLVSDFCFKWTAHGNDLHAKGEVLFSRFIMLMVDENLAGASGCSIDKSIHFIQTLEKKYNIQLFNRMLAAIKVGEEVKVVNASQIKEQLITGILNENTSVFNTLIETKEELDHQFIIPLKESWMAKYLQPEKI